MSAFTDFLVNSLIPMIEAAGESKLVLLLQKFHDDEPEEYAASMIAGHTFIKPLLKYVAGTETKIDDGIVEAINESITISATTNGIIFSDVTA